MDLDKICWESAVGTPVGPDLLRPSPIMNITNQDRECHSERSEESHAPYRASSLSFLRASVHALRMTFPNLVVTIHDRPRAGLSR